MKTTKKGFTLIELIVVIAIIGVLAAILVPTMLGYVRKSKISSANSTASSIYKAINSALTELDEEGVDVSGLYYMNYSSGAWTQSASEGEAETSVGNDQDAAAETEDMQTYIDDFTKKVENFFSDIRKLDKNGGVKAFIKDGSCIACAAAADKTYTGTYPAGVVTSDTYESYKNDLGAACNAAHLMYYGARAKSSD
ncbi:MAG: type II secretion system protein [Ruminococcus sp.]|nr:type II secretion system protein [Ruminococcus sp.]